MWKVRRVSKRGRWQRLDVLGVAGPVLGGGGVSGAVKGLEGRRVSEATWLPTARQKERLVEAPPTVRAPCPQQGRRVWGLTGSPFVQIKHC